MLKCYGDGCPVKEECYRFTQPYTKRDAFAKVPYNHTTGTCKEYHTNIPDEKLIRETAYYIWLRNGEPENREIEHWYEAYLSLCLSTGRVKSVLGTK